MSCRGSVPPEPFSGGTDYPLELIQELHPGHPKLGVVGPLEIAVDDPDVLSVMDRKALARVHL